MTAETVYGLLKTQAKLSPSNIAIFAPARDPLTCVALCRHVEQVVGTLNFHRIGRGDRVALVLPNGAEMLTAFLTVACGATAAPLNPAFSAGEFDSALQDLRIGAVIVQASTESPVREVAENRSIPILELSFDTNDPAGIFSLTGARPAASSSIRSPAFAGDDDIALVLCTSGTTARPKIVPSTQSAMIAGANLTIAALQLAASDRYLCVMPMYHTHALITSLATLLAGGAVIAVPPFDVGDFFGWLAEISTDVVFGGTDNSSSDCGASTRIPGDRRRKFAALHSFFRGSIAAYRAGRIRRCLSHAGDRRLRHDRNLLIRDEQSAAAA